jgi:NADH-quinone oxidoreductase subunit J
LIEMALTLLGSRLAVPVGSVAGPTTGASNTRALGMLVYTDYVYPFEIAAVILLVAIIAAIALTHRRRRETKYQNPAEQVKARPRDRLRILNIPTEKNE